MKTRYKFIHFEKGNDKRWVCKNNKTGDLLGHVEFYPGWRQWIFSAADEFAVFSVSCLRDIIHFIGQLK